MAKQVTTSTSKAAPAATPVASAPRGAVMAARWAVKGNGAPTMPATIFAMPPATVITCMVAANPKGGNSAPAFSAYGFGGKPSKGAVKGNAATVGATTTLAQYYVALHALLAQNAKAAAAHVAWDFNHGFIAISQAVPAPAPAAQPVQQAA